MISLNRTSLLSNWRAVEQVLACEGTAVWLLVNQPCLLSRKNESS